MITVLILLATPTIALLGFFLIHLLVQAYYATEMTWFFFLVLIHLRLEPENKPYLDNIFFDFWILLKNWFRLFINYEEINFVTTKAKGTKYYFQGWRFPKIERNPQFKPTE